MNATSCRRLVAAMCLEIYCQVIVTTVAAIFGASYPQNAQPRGHDIKNCADGLAKGMKRIAAKQAELCPDIQCHLVMWQMIKRRLTLVLSACVSHDLSHD